MRRFLLLLLCLSFSSGAFAQGRGDTHWVFRGFGSSPPAACAPFQYYILSTDGSYRYCIGGVFVNPFTGGGGGISSLNGLTVSTQLFANANDTNVTLSIGSATATHTFTLGWTGTLAAGRLNSNVVQSVTNDTNVTGSISSQALTLGWTGTLAAGRLNSNVVQSVVNDTNVTGSIASQALTLGWTGTLAGARMTAMVGDSGSGGTKGAVPAPAAGDAAAVKFLRADGVWAVPPASGEVAYSAASLTLTAGTRFAPPGGGGTPSTTESDSQVKAPSGATVKNFQVTVSAAPGTGNSYAFTWRKGGADQSLTCTISDTATTCQDITNSFTLAQNDLVDVKIVSSGTIVTTPMVSWLVDWGNGTSGGSGGASISSGLLASLPGTCTHTSTQSDLYFYIDWPIDHPAICTATNVYTNYLGTVSVSAASSQTFTTENSGTQANSGGTVLFTAPSSGSNNLRLFSLTVPSAPYTRTVFISPSLTSGTSSTECGIGLYDGTGIVALTYQGSGNVQFAHWTNPTTFSATVTSKVALHPTGPIGLRIQDDNTNRIVFFSMDKGANWEQLGSEGRTTFITATKIVFIVNDSDSVQTSCTAINWN